MTLVIAAGCGQPPKPAPKRYPIKGQVLGVVTDRQELTLKHEDKIAAYERSHAVAG